MFAHTPKICAPALLMLLGLPLACDRSPTAPPSEAPPHVETALLPGGGGGGSGGAGCGSGSTIFDGCYYYSIDVQLAAQRQYGASATAIHISDHLYGWRALVGNTVYSIDMARAVREQYGAGYILGAVGVGIYDWRAVHWSALSAKVLPVMVIAGDYFYDVSAVQAGLANLRSTLAATQSWYANAMWDAGSQFGSINYHMLQPLVVFLQSQYNAARWNSFSSAGGSVLWSFAWNEYASVYPTSTLGSSGAALRVVLAPLTGICGGICIVNGGGANVQNTLIGGSVVPAFAVVPPAISSSSCSWGTDGSGLTAACRYATYSVAHELGFTFGLQSCPVWDSYCAAFSIMGEPAVSGNTLPPAALLEWGQAYTLSTSGFFN